MREQRVIYGEQSLPQLALRQVEARAIWVTRWDYKTAEEVNRIVDNCARTGFNMILFQVRGNATAFYRSSLEPWAWELTSTGPATTGRNPGFDPLQAAIDRARKRRIELHAYMNVFPGWRGQKYPPPQAGQVWTQHPEWFMVDGQGRQMIARDHDVDPNVGTFYSFLNPAVPAVQDYTVAVFREVAERYGVDGLHMDYVRYPHEVGDYSYDTVSLRRFFDVTGKKPDEAADQWARWRGQQVTRVVHRIHDECKQIAPHLMITASVGRDPVRARDVLMQPSAEWLAAGKLDAVMPMIYTTDNSELARSVTEYVTKANGRLVVAGLMVGKDPKAVVEQIGVARTAGAHGLSLFSYSAIFPEHKPNDIARALIEGPFKRPAAVPVHPTDRTAAFDERLSPLQPGAVK